MYRALHHVRRARPVEGDTALADSCTRKAAALKTAVNAGGYWDAAAGLYRDTRTSIALPAGRQLARRLVRPGRRRRRVAAAISAGARGALDPRRRADAGEELDVGAPVPRLDGGAGALRGRRRRRRRWT